MNSRINNLETTCVKLLADNKCINIRKDKLENTCEKLSNENKEPTQHTNNLDNYSRRSSVVIRGITEPQQESNADCVKAARDFFNPIRSGGGGALKAPFRFFVLTHLILEQHSCALGTFPKKNSLTLCGKKKFDWEVMVWS